MKIRKGEVMYLTLEAFRLGIIIKLPNKLLKVEIVVCNFRLMGRKRLGRREDCVMGGT